MRSAIVSLLMPSLLGGTIVTGAAIKGSASHKSGVKSRGQGADNLLQGRATQLVRRGEPGTGDDDFPDDPPHPNKLDQVETAFNDAIELTSYVLSNIDGDNTIFPHYFDTSDREEITRIFRSINNGDNGNDMLSDIHVQTTDSNNQCDGRTLSYLKNGASTDTDPPYIVLCPTAFNKKAVTELNGADPSTDNRYATCEDMGDHVSYNMNTLGMTLLHEYLHYDKMIQSSFGSIVDETNGYGPVNVYDNLDKSKARTNADSYAYYASEILWHELCETDYQAPRAGTDDADPDCGNQVCYP